MKIAVVQHDIVWEDGNQTRALLIPMIAEAAASGARLVVLSEMFATGFSMSPERVAEPAGGPNENFLADQARLHGIWLVGSIAQKQQPGELAVNVAVLAGPHGESHRYVKIHPFSYGGEHQHYQAGSDLLTVTIEGVRTSIFICYDLRFADEFWQLAPVTDAYVVVANWPDARREHWQVLLRARALDNLAYVIGCNRVGNGDGLNYAGDSAVIDPLGRTLVQASHVPTILLADVDPTVVSATRDRFGFLADRR